jgi:hypothetical protein
MTCDDHLYHDPFRRRLHQPPHQQRPRALPRTCLAEAARGLQGRPRRRWWRPGLGASLLRGLALTVRELAGPAWLAANTDDPDIAALAAPDDAPAPPPPADLDELLARVLWARFATFGSQSAR